MLPFWITLALLGADPAPAVPPAGNASSGDEAAYLQNPRQFTFGLPRAGEGYFSPKGDHVVYQAYPVGYPFYQIYVQGVDEKAPRLISTGRGRTTCAYFHPSQQALIFASSHTDPEIEQTEKKARDEAAAGGRRRYQWDFDPHMEIYRIGFDGTGLTRLTNSPGYDAEGSYSPDGTQIVFTSSRDGDPDLYVMDADGGNVRQLTNQPGYDGGPFFSPDGRWIIFRSDRDKEHMLQLFAISVDGKVERQLTRNLDEVNWCPFFHPNGESIIWSGADYSKGPASAKFHLFQMDVTQTADDFLSGAMRQITFGNHSNVLPVFSPAGDKLLWTSTRGPDGSSQLWMADWRNADAAK